MKLCIFAGTVEGRTLAQRLAGYCELHICVATEYGGLLDRVSGATLHVGRMDEAEMRTFLLKTGVDTVVDATHPYAVEVSRNLRNACEKSAVEYLRLIRRTESRADGAIVYVDSAAAAAEYLAETKGNVFLTTGVKELSAFSALPKERLYARIIPAVESLQIALNYLEPGHVMAALGPFNEETNVAALHSTGACFLVTKQSGSRGGYPEKIAAAAQCGVTCVVIGRPEEAFDGGCPEEEILALLQERLQILKGCKLRVDILGCGSGEAKTMTLEAYERLQAAQVLIGSKRLVEELGAEKRDVQREVLIMPEQIAETIFRHGVAYSERREDLTIAVLMSGDTSFYSGTKKLTERLESEEYKEALAREGVELTLRIYPGISSVSMLAAAARVSTEDAYAGSMHGRELDLERIVEKWDKVFLLTDKENSPKSIAKRLAAAGFTDARITIGSEMGTKRERVVTKYVGEYDTIEDEALCVVLIQRTKKEE